MDIVHKLFTLSPYHIHSHFVSYKCPKQGQSKNIVIHTLPLKEPVTLQVLFIFVELWYAGYKERYIAQK